jgi:DNA-binding response OmpR family regulator
MTRVMEKSRHNLKVEVAATLRRARAALARGQTELILLDNNLPDGLGANFALELARDAKLSSIPVILVSDWPSPFMWEKAASAGVTYVLNKTDFNTRYVNAALQKSRKRKTVSI